MKIHILFVAGVSLFLGAQTVPASPALAAPPAAEWQASDRDQLLQAVGEVDALYAAGKVEEATTRMEALMASRLYSGAPQEVRPAVDLLYGVLAIETRDAKTALPYLRSGLNTAAADAEVWRLYMHAAHAEGEDKDAVLAAAIIAEQWPMTLAEVPEEAIYDLSIRADKSAFGDRDLQMRFLNALFNANWRGQSAGEPAHMWSRLALLLLEDGAANRAGAVLERVDNAMTAALIRADKRFDRAVAQMSGRLDVDSLANTEIETHRAYVRAHPRKLGAVANFTYALLQRPRYEEVLSITDAVIARTKLDALDNDYEDGKEKYVWILDNRARALAGLGRHEDRVAQLREAAALAERLGDDTVSHAINLGNALNEIGRPAEALEAVKGVQDDQLSAFGRMQLQGVRFAALHDLKDSGADAALIYLRTHEEDARSSYLSAQLWAGDEAGAAATLIRLLEDEASRDDALLLVQTMLDPPFTSRVQRTEMVWGRVLARPEVRATIERYGRINTYPLAATGF